MKKNKLLVCIILVMGVSATIYFSYQYQKIKDTGRLTTKEWTKKYK